VVVYNGGQSEGPNKSDSGIERRRIAVYGVLSVQASRAPLEFGESYISMPMLDKFLSCSLLQQLVPALE
jgi:hypothetical protein